MEKNKKELIDLHSTSVKIGGLTVPVKIVCSNMGHLQNRLKKWQIQDLDEVLYVVEEGITNFLKTNLRPNKENITIVDKQSCICVPCVVTLHRKYGFQTVYMLTVYKFDGKSRLPDEGVFYINEDNPSEEFSEMEKMVDWYGDTWSNGGSASSENPIKFVELNYNWTPSKYSGKAIGEPLTTKAYEKLNDPENSFLRSCWKRKYDEYISNHESYTNDKSTRDKEEKLDRASSIMRKRRRDAYKENFWNNRIEMKRIFADADSGPIPGINQDLRDVDVTRKKAYDDMLSQYDKAPIPGLNQGLRDIDNARRKSSKNESIKLTLNDLKYMINESIKILKQKRLI